nr:hypothetical protein [Tanacetum cinerariifolium]
AASVAVDDVHVAVDEPSIPSPTPTTQPPPRSQDLPSTLQVQPTPPPSPIAQPPLPQQQPQPSQDAEISMDLLHTLLETCTTLTRRVKHLERDKIAQTLEITKLKQRVKKLEKRNKLEVSRLSRLKRAGTSQRVDTFEDTVMDDVSKQGRIIANIDADKDVTLKDVADIAKEVAVDVEIEKNADVQGRQAESQAQIYQIDLEHADKVLSIQDDEIDPAELKEVIEVVTTAKLMTEVVTATSVTITAATTPILVATITAAPNNGKGIMVEEPKPLKKQAQIEQDEAYARELKMDYFKGMSYDDISPIFEKKFNSNVAFLEKTKEQMEEEDSKVLKRTSESQSEKAAKKQKLDEEVEELKKHLQIVPNDDDDVYTEATPLARRVPIVDYEIYTENNKA